MSKKINIPALAALLVVVVAAPGPVFAQNFRVDPSQTQLQRLKRQLPSNAYGSVAGSAAVPRALGTPRGRPFETDPDPNVRFEMNRDDRDRRAGSS
jgi:hypothetical protein